MTDEQIRMLLRLTGDEARMLIEEREYSLYRDMQEQMVKLGREYGVRMPLNCLQFLYYGNDDTQAASRELNAEAPF